MLSNYKLGIIVDNHRLFADSFSALLEKTGLFDHIHIESDTNKLLQFLIKNSRKKVFLFLDYYLDNDRVGVDIINDVRRLNKNTNIIVVTTVTNPGVIQQINVRTPEGIISKVSGFDIILDCIQNVERGKTYCCPIIKDKLEKVDAEVVLFTSRQIEILKCFASGLSVPQTSDKLHISLNTVVTHRRRMMQKADCNTIIKLLDYAYKVRILERN
ncbi:LuxR C-terminal-related transcriptional regulator [Myroides sp. C15-4]|uniref:LuxR C-terminal-related transcriptional regulator n=1 Tax=Myroides sp. C15-4 TaxID=3400532 RepID=UPI003D2F6998